jgi:RNA polymerase sigma-70 factor (ECF subfamily)
MPAQGGDVGTGPRPFAGAENFDQEFDRVRRALLVHCYQMVGSHHDAEDLVQETYLRARRAIADFEGRSSVKTWLYKIATNACLTALGHRSRRVLPSGIGVPSGDPNAHVEENLTIPWLEPLPDAALAPSRADDPANIVVERESVRLALVAALQYLPARQRAALLLREVLGWPTGDIAEAMGITVAAVKSLLQRARSRLSELQADLEESPFPVVTERSERELLERWMQAFETIDIQAIEDLIRDDFVIESTQHTTWFQGVAVCVPFLERVVPRQPGAIRLLATRMNGQPAAAAYARDESGHYRARYVAVLTVAEGKIAKVTNFLGADIVVAAGLPAVLPADVAV